MQIQIPSNKYGSYDRSTFSTITGCLVIIQNGRVRAIFYCWIVENVLNFRAVYIRTWKKESRRISSFELVQKCALNRICICAVPHRPVRAECIVHLLFSTSKGLRRAPSCRCRFPFSRLFSGAALSCGPLVALFSAPGGYFEKVAFHGFPLGFLSSKSV